MEEARGFKSEIGKKKAINKQRKKDAKTQKQRRQDKIDDLNSRSRSWIGLENRDIRTPSIYFQNREISDQKVKSIKSRLDDLNEYLQDLKKNPKSTRATKILADRELKKVTKKKDINNAVNMINKIENDDSNGAAELMKDSLDERIHRRIEPYLKLAGKEIKDQIFR